MIKILIFSLSLVAGAAHAAVAANAAFDVFMSQVVGNGQQTVGFGGGGQAVIQSANATIGGGGATVSQSGVLQSANGGRVAINAVAAIPKIELGLAVARIAVRTVGPIALALALADVLRQAGVTSTFNSATGKNEFKQEIPAGSCGASTAYANNWAASPNGFGTCNPINGVKAHSLTTGPEPCGIYGYCASSGNSILLDFAPTTVGTSEKPATEADIARLVAAKSGWPTPDNVDKAVAEGAPLLQPSEKIKPSPATVTGPATAGEPRVGTTEKVVPNGSTPGTEKTTTTCVDNVTYAENKVTIAEKCTDVVMAPNGSTTTGVITTKPDPQKPVAEKVITCGLPDSPACKIDETGTKTPVPVSEWDDKLTKIETDMGTQRDKIGSSADKPFFDGFTSLFVVPAIATCQPFELPRNMGSINPCPVVDGVRSAMGFIWAIGGLFLCLRMVKESV